MPIGTPDHASNLKVFERTGSIIARRIAGEFILVPISGDLANMQRIFTLTPVAEFIWERLDGQRNLSDIRDDIVARFDVERDQAGSDVLDFVTELATARLVREVVR